MSNFSEPSSASTVSKWKDTAGTSRPLDFSFGDKSHRKKNISEHRLSVLANEKWAKTKIKSPLLPTEEKQNLQQDNSKGEAVLKKRTLVASKVDGIPPDGQRKHSRGFRGSLPRTDNSITYSKFKKLSMRFKFETKRAKDNISFVDALRNNSTDRHVRYHSGAVLQAPLTNRAPLGSKPTFESTSSSSECCSYFLPPSRPATRECLRYTYEKGDERLSSSKKSLSNKSFPKSPKCIYPEQVQDRSASNSSIQLNGRWWFCEPKQQVIEHKEKYDSGFDKKFIGKKLLPGFFAPTVKSSSNCQNASRVSKLKQTALRSLRQNLFHACFEKAGIGSEIHQHNDSKLCWKNIQKKPINSSVDNCPSENLFEDTFDIRKCACYAKEIKHPDADHNAPDASTESFTKSHVNLPPIYLDDGNPHGDLAFKHNLKNSTLPSDGKGEEMIKSETAQQQKNLKTVFFPPLASKKFLEKDKKYSLTQDADDEISSASQTSYGCDVSKMPPLQNTKSPTMDFERNLQKFANFKRKMRQKTKEKNLPTSDTSESSRSSSVAFSLNKSLRRKKRRKKKLRKARSNPENSSLKCEWVSHKPSLASIGSEGDDEMDVNDNISRLL